MKKLLAFLTILLFLLLIWLSWNWYKNTVLCCPEVQPTGALYYECGTDEPVTTADWAAKREEILAALPEGDNLLIIGPYFAGEDRTIGLARAEKVAKLFSDKLSTDRIETTAQQAGDCEEGLSDIYHHTLFKNEMPKVVQVDNKTFIYFKYDSNKGIVHPHVVQYLNGLVDELKQSGKTVMLTGHTDHDGAEDYNYKLGLERANYVKKYLINHGVPESQIEVDSKGKMEPIADNSTPEGRQRNRRVEIVIK